MTSIGLETSPENYYEAIDLHHMTDSVIFLIGRLGPLHYSEIKSLLPEKDMRVFYGFANKEICYSTTQDREISAFEMLPSQYFPPALETYDGIVGLTENSEYRYTDLNTKIEQQSEGYERLLNLEEIARRYAEENFSL